MRNTGLSRSVKCLASVCIFLFIMSLSSYGQSDQKAVRRVYAQMAVGPTFIGGYGTNFGIQTVFKKNGTLSFSFQDIREPSEIYSAIIADYSYLGLDAPLYPPGAQHDVQKVYRLTVYSVSGGKCFEVGRSVWLTTEAGVSVAKDEKLTSYRVYSGGVVYPDPYFKPEREKLITAGGLFRADLNWAFSSFAGLGIGTFAWINTIQSHAGAEIKLIAGWMNRKPKVKKRN